MVKNTNLFSQLLQFMPNSVFAGIVKKHNGERHARVFTCRQQFVAMLFCVMGKAQSLREISGGLATCEGKLRHLGITAPKKSSLAYANQHRPWEIYQETFFHILAQLFGSRMEGPVDEIWVEFPALE